MRADVDLLLSHDERAVKQSEIADCAATVLANRERAAGVTGNMFANDNCAGLFADHLAKNLRGLAIKAFAEVDVRRDRVRPPILFHMSIVFNVAHLGNFPEANSLA